MDWVYLILIFILAFVVVGNVLYLLFFPLIEALEWLRFALKITYDSYQQIKGRKYFVNLKDDTKQSLVERVKIVGYISQIKGYTRKTYYRQYAEDTKEEVPRLFKMLDWIIHRQNHSKSQEKGTTKIEYNHFRLILDKPLFK
jgi:hypothetical protein